MKYSMKRAYLVFTCDNGIRGLDNLLNSTPNNNNMYSIFSFLPSPSVSLYTFCIGDSFLYKLGM